MPELPEVQTVVSSISPKLVNQRINLVRVVRRDVIDPPDADFPTLLTGRRIAGVTRRGKRIVFQLDDGNRFFIHLGMTGRLGVEAAGFEPQPHTHVIITIGDGKELHFRDPRRFGGIWWLGKTDCDRGMGPEPLAVRPTELAKRLSRTTRAIKNALLDQTVLAGLGNIYVDESLFTAGIHPLTPANNLAPAQIAKLNRAIKATLRKAINHRGSTLRDYRDGDGLPGYFQKLHRVYGRAGKPCARCGGAIARIVLGGRSTCFCPTCQPAAKKTGRRKTPASPRPIVQPPSSTSRTAGGIPG